jgi:PKD domain-containing protein/calcineurin-like phosphoesterase family protein
MTSRAIARLRGFLLVLAATACGGHSGGGTGPSNKPVVQVGSNTPSLPVGTTYTLSATFSDTSNSSPWTYDIAWGDGQSATGTKTSISPITGTHTYATEGDYHVAVTVTNQMGASGNASFTVSATSPVILAAGDIGDCTRLGDDSTAMLLDTLAGVVVPLGDDAYENGTLDEYNNCYAPTWGRQKARTTPIPGNHDYNTPGAPGYYGYFGAAAGDPAKGYYSFTLGSWFVIILNTGTDQPVNYEAGSPQEQWLRSELASHSQACVLTMFHHPRFSTIKDRSPITYYTTAIWNALYEYGADLVLNGHDHAYQRFAPQKPDGTRDDTHGIRQIAVGTGGGETLYSWADTLPAGSNIEVRDNHTHGILKLTLRAGGYDWKFVPASGATFTDSGSGTCHGRP